MAAPPNYYPFSPVWDDEMQRQYDEWASGPSAVGASVGPVAGAATDADPAAVAPMDPAAPGSFQDPVYAAPLHPAPTAQNPYPEMEWDGHGQDPAKMPAPSADPLVDTLSHEYKSLSHEGATALAAKLRAKAEPYTGTPPKGTTRDGIERASALSALTDADIGWAQNIGKAPQVAQARLAQATGPIGTVGQIGQNVDPNAAPPSAGALPTFTPDELAAVGQPVTVDMPEQDVSRPELGDMPEEYMGRSPQTIDMPDDFAGRELGPQDPYGDVDAAMAKSYAPDAVSGGVTPEQAYGEQQAAATGGPVADQTTGAPQMPDEYLSDSELGQKWSELPVEEQIQKRADLDEARNNFQATRFLEESRRAQQQAAADLHTFQQSQQIAAARSKEIEHDAEILAMKHNPLDDIGIGQKVAAAGAAIIGGFLGNQGGVETIDKLISQAVAQHQQQLQLGQQNLAARRGDLTDQVARDADMYKAVQTYRVGAWNQFINGLESEVQQYDPRGSTAMRVMDQINEAKNKRAQAVLAGAEEDRKRVEAAIKLGQEQQKINETMRHNMATEKPKGTGEPSAALALENPLVAGLSPKDRERAVMSPDGKSLRLALDHETAIAQREEIRSGNAAIGAADSVIADLSNDTDLMTKLKAKAGLNPQEIAVLKSKLSLLKPMIAKVAAGTGRIPLAELHAVDAATDDPSNFTAETLAQIRAMRDATVNDLADKFGPEYPNFITKDSFGSAPKIAEPPNINTISAPLLSAPVKGAKGYASPGLADADGQLKQAFDQFVAKPGLGGQAGFQELLDRMKGVQQGAVSKISGEITELSAKKKLTPEETERLHNDTQALRVRTEMIRAIDDWRAKSVDQARQEHTDQADQAAAAGRGPVPTAARGRF